MAIAGEAEKAIKKTKHYCYECGAMIGGTAGVDWHYVKNLGFTRWYCDKCMKKILRGE